MEAVSWWVGGFLGKYPEIMVSFACFLFLLFFRLRRRDGLPTNWPVVGSLPAISVNAGRVHEWLTEFLRVAPGMSHVARGPWGSPVDMLFTANPADVAHVFTTNFGNYPKGEDFAAMFDVLGNGIFNADGDSWAFQRRKAHALLSDARFRAAVAASTARKLDEGLVPLLDGVAAGGAVVDLQDVFMRLTFDLTAMFIFGTDPGCLAADFPRVPFAAAMDEAEAVLFYRHVAPVAWLKLQTYLNIGHHKKMTKAQQVLDASIAEFVSLRRERAASAGSNADGSDAADLLTLYLACQDEIGKDGSEFDRFLRDTTLNLMIAGRDTTSSALTWFFWLLSNHPGVEAKILAELRENLPSSGGRRRRRRRRRLPPQRRGSEAAGVPARGAVGVAPAVPAGAVRAQGGSAARHASERAGRAAVKEGDRVLLLDGAHGGGVGQGLPGVPAGAVADGGGAAQARAVVQVRGVQRGAPYVHRQGPGVHSDEGRRGRRPAAVPGGGRARCPRGEAQAVHHTPHEGRAQGEGLQEASRC